MPKQEKGKNQNEQPRKGGKEEQEIDTPQNWREARRMRAGERQEAGWKHKDIAAARGVTEGAVSHWFTKEKTLGVQALRHQPPPGAQPRRTKEPLAQLPDVLARGAEALGFQGQVWTTARVVEMIGSTSGSALIARIAVVFFVRSGSIGTSPSTKPRNAMRSRWKPGKTNDGQRSKTVRRGKAHDRLCGSVRFSRLPMAVRPSAPTGKKPTLRVTLTCEHLLSLGGITPEGTIIMQTPDHSSKGRAAVRFFQMLTREISGKLRVV
jgi:hypothetical protein